ncbi:DgyrCDS10452 [Dimorphilus gyrociliatus]|uniref:DgyrCDS10452 n=1 Tax=Dimorphilus gyrociliatus TaxID=2664684 RepID=A0A7I8W074_9ANNE|nr:DgyrCDS10452 [Dimorphilus gyrociliatus]
MAKYLAQVIVAGAQVVGRAFTRALRQEIQNSQRAAQARSTKSTSQQAAANSVSGITVQEALQVLNIKDIHDLETLNKNYDHLFKVNDKSKGGSLYLQSKVVRAKERIDMELKQMEKDNQTASE